ncbi:cyclophilin-like fold protein [Kaarinaea lacus]
MQKIKIISGSVELLAEVLDTPTGRSIFNSLPIESRVNTWGDEIYFSVPVQAEREADAKDIIEPGEIAFWVEGSCIAIGFGRTPISQGNEIRLAARTNIWAITKDDVKRLSSIDAGDIVRVERFE